MGDSSTVDTLVIGAGQAGLAVSRCLQEHGVSHAVLERNRIGHSWRQQRWDSFHLNTPNGVNLLPGDDYDGDAPWGFVPKEKLLSYFEDYRARHDLPVEEGVEVTAVRRVDDGFEVEANGQTRRCRHVVLCTGDQNAPLTPSITLQIPEDVQQIHTADYRRPDQLPDGATLVVGSGQSGVQIAEDLLEADRRLYLSTSAVGRAPRRYRGKDLIEWMIMAGLAEQRPEDLEDPREQWARQGQISGTRGGHTVSLHQLARDGATLLGRLNGVDGRRLTFGDDLLANVASGDEASTKLRAGLDMFISKAGIDAPPAEPDPAEAPFEGLEDMAVLREIHLDEPPIRSVIWATGFGPKFDYLDPTLLDDHGRPRHTDGACDLPGLYCVGLMWLRRRVSGLIAGVKADAEHVAAQIAQA
jgi:putative flavoprotein involved in K+ transport